MTMTKGWMLKGLLALLAMAGAGIAQVHAQTVEYVHTDALGSVVAITDAAGNVTERNEYEPYGNDLTGVKDGPGYTGHVSDAATGLSYMQQRYYDPGIGRFLSVDPVTAYEKPLTNFNRYMYAINNPYKFTDPDGRMWGVAAKILKVAVKGGDVAATVAGAVEDGKVLLSRDASLGQRAIAAGSLVSEVVSPVSARDVKAGMAAIEGAGDAARFTVTPKGTVLDTSKDVNLVSNTKPTNQGGEFLQIHSSHTDARAGNVQSHTHTSQTHTNPVSGETRTTRSDARPTTSGDIDRADSAVRSGEMRERSNRQDKGG